MKEELPKDIREKLPIAKKVLEKLVFDNYDIPFDIKPEYTRFSDHWIFNLWIDVDVDRYVSFSPSFQQEYKDYIDLLYDRVKNSLKYVNLQNDFGGLFFDYINDDQVDEYMERLNQKLYRELENKYNVRPHEIKDAGISYFLYKSDAVMVDMRIEFGGENITGKDEETGEETQLVSCTEIQEVMFDIYNREGIYLEYEDLVCY